MVAQTRFINAVTAAITTGGNLINEIVAQRTHNAHGLRLEINVESEAMEANANGFWDIYMFPGDIIDAVDLPATWADMDDENVSQYLWGHGLWMASNQTPFHMVFAPKTSRNIPKSGRVYARVHVEGTVPVLTNNRINSLLSYFVSQ